MAGDGRSGPAGLTANLTGSNRIRLAYEQVADQLRELIVSGELAVGERLPTEDRLGAHFGVSRSTVREALRVLSSRHLVVTTRGADGGTFVAHPPPEEIAQYLETNLSLLSAVDKMSAAELLEARTFLEVPAARLAAERRLADEMQVLERCTEVHPTDMTRGQSYEANRVFHAAILRASGNRALPLLVQPLFEVLRQRFLQVDNWDQWSDQVFVEHLELYRLISDGDGDGAAQAMTNHLCHLAPTYGRIDRQQRPGRQPAGPDEPGR